MTPFMSIPGLGGPTPSFAKGKASGEASFSLKYYMHGSKMGLWRMFWADGGYGDGGTRYDLKIYAPSEGGTGYFDYLNGAKQTASNQAWRPATVDLSPHWGKTGCVVIVYFKNITGWQGDLCFDTMSLTLNGVSTDYSVGSTTNQWKCTDPGQTYVSDAATYASFSSGTAGTEVTPTTANNVRPGVIDSGYTASSSTQTGPNSGDGGSGYYLYIETSSIPSINMNSTGRYCFLYTTQMTLSD